jgi:hypothetical protein
MPMSCSRHALPSSHRRGFEKIADQQREQGGTHRVQGQPAIGVGLGPGVAHDEVAVVPDGGDGVLYPLGGLAQVDGAVGRERLVDARDEGNGLGAEGSRRLALLVGADVLVDRLGRELRRLGAGDGEVPGHLARLPVAADAVEFPLAQAMDQLRGHRGVGGEQQVGVVEEHGLVEVGAGSECRDGDRLHDRPLRLTVIRKPL